MFSALLTFIGNGLSGVFGLIGNAMSGGVNLFYDAGAITELGEVLLLSAVVGLALFGIRFIRGAIPFLK
jgi:hypothetical protein